MQTKSMLIQQNQNHSSQFYKNYQNTKKRNRSFFFDYNPSTNSQFIFDDVYKNQQEKKKFQNNPKYAYFNSLVKMKSKMKCSGDLYNKVFLNSHKSEDFQPLNKNNNTGYENNFDSKYQSAKNIRPNRTASQFHVQKMNNHVFKIFKQYFNRHGKTSYNMPPVQDISFQIHYQKNKEPSLNKDNNRKPRLDEIMAQYRRVNKIQKQRLQKQKQSKRFPFPQKTLKLFQKKGITNGLGINPLISMNSTTRKTGFKFNPS